MSPSPSSAGIRHQKYFRPFILGLDLPTSRRNLSSAWRPTSFFLTMWTSLDELAEIGHQKISIGAIFAEFWGWSVARADCMIVVVSIFIHG